MKNTVTYEDVLRFMQHATLTPEQQHELVSVWNERSRARRKFEKARSAAKFIVGQRATVTMKGGRVATVEVTKVGRTCLHARDVNFGNSVYGAATAFTPIA